LFPWKDQPIDAKQLVGRWKLESIARREPADFKVKEWTIEFTDDGCWRAVGLVIGPWESLQLKSSATWRAQGDQIFFTINDRDELLLFDDPVITPRLRSSAEFRCSRIKE
jgi:hypothetical protein